MKRIGSLLALGLALGSLGGMCTPASVQQSRASWDAEHERMLAHLPKESWRVVWKSYHGETLRLWLERDATIAGIPCHGEVELSAGHIGKATLSAAYREGRFELPARSTVRYGHPNGTPGLLSVELGDDALIDGVPCAAKDSHGAVAETRFDETGVLLWCTLAAPMPQNPDCARGALATFSPEGVTCGAR